MRILLVTDDHKTGKIVPPTLEAEGFAVYLVADSKLTLFLSEQHDYRIIVLDIMATEAGLRLCRRLRNHNPAPTLILSAAGDVNTKIAFFNAGADGYVAKPFAIEEVAARVRALLRRSRQIVSPTATPPHRNG